MDEKQIEEQLAQKTVAPTPQEQPEHIPDPNEDEAFHNSLPLENTLEKIKFQDYFEIPSAARHSAEVATQLDRIIDWARDEAKSSDYNDILRVINDQERVMGSRLKDNRLMRLYQFVTVNTQRKRLMEQERALYND